MLGRLFGKLRAGFLLNIIRLFRLREESEKVARGFALGLIVNLWPTFGFGVVISGFMAKLFGGNAVSGLIGGATLTFFWPVLFYLNMQMGALVLQRRAPLREVEDVTERTMSALVWGQTFTTGAVLNSLIVGISVYLLLRLLYMEIRPTMLAYFRRHAREYRRRDRVKVA